MSANRLFGWTVPVVFGSFAVGIAEERPGAKAPSIDLEPQKGKVTVGKELAELNLPDDLLFLSPKDARKVLEEVWGNMKDPSVLGMIVPEGFDPEGDAQWAIEIKYEADGYVKDDDAAAVDFDALLVQMQKDTRDANPELLEAGHAPVELIGWATKPRYDAKEKKLYWAKELRFGDSETNTLNYNIRILGRHGVLLLNAIADMSQLAEVEKVTPRVLAAVDFKPGKRYEDFDPGLDKVAAYGIGGLIAGKIALKAGLLKAFWVAIIAAKKFVILGVVAVGAFVAKLLGRKKQSPA